MGRQAWNGLVFVGNGSATVSNWFRDQFLPAAAKNEWGADTLLREIRGPACFYDQFMRSLKQGATYNTNTVFYLQTWQEIADPVFPGARLLYKGLTDGIPTPIGENSTGTKVAQKSATITSSAVARQINPDGNSNEVTAIRLVEYYSPETSWRYITSRKPNGPSFSSLNNSAAVRGIRSRIVATNEGVSLPFAGNAPSALLGALDMPVIPRITSHNSTPIIGTPWWECTDVVALELAGD